MKYSEKIRYAIVIATRFHHGQFRRGDETLPYIIHPYSVAMLLFDYTDDEDVIAAALLHDTLEDTAYTVNELNRDFGPRVREIVCAVTEDKQASWRKRKEGYIEGLKVAGEEALLVATADKIHNLEAHISEVKRVGVKHWDPFNKGAVEYLWFYGEVLKVIQENLDSDIVQKLEVLYEDAKKLFA